MANSTTFLPPAAYNHIEGKTIVATRRIDFADEETVSGGTLDVLRIPQGAFVKRAGFHVEKAEATITIALGDSASGTQFLTAQDAHTAADVAFMSVDAAQKFYAAEDALRLTVGAATANSAIVTAFVEYFIIPAARAV